MRRYVVRYPNLPGICFPACLRSGGIILAKGATPTLSLSRLASNPIAWAKIVPAAANLTSDNRKTPRENPTPFSRPLLPVVLALMAGLASPAWGLRLPEKWLAAALVSFWAILGVLWLARRPVRLLPLVLFWLLGVAFYQQALQPVFPLYHLVICPRSRNSPSRVA